jgi:hypothetical protein
VSADTLCAWKDGDDVVASAFAELPALYVLQLAPEWTTVQGSERLWELTDEYDLVEIKYLGYVDDSGSLCVDPNPSFVGMCKAHIPVPDLRRAFLGTLDW